MELLGKKKKYWLGLSGALIVLSAIFVMIFGLRLGLDFAGGSVLEVQNPKSKSQNEIIENLKDLNLENLTVTSSEQGLPAGKAGIVLKTKPIDQEAKQKILEKTGGEELRFETVGPTVSRDLVRKSVYAVVVASVGIVIYLAWAFRRATTIISSWRFGLIAIVALLHDLAITVGAFALMGKLVSYEVDSLFITALLTVLGFSVHDTIVVFDRIRENLKLHPHLDFESLANASLIQTLARSLNTSLTVILVLLAMFLLGGDSIKPFVFALLVGITVGTYSSIFVATPLLVIWSRRSRKAG